MKLHRNHLEEVICPNCHHVQWEYNLTEGDKFAWLCKNCKAAVEGNQLHLLQEIASFTGKEGGNVCTGFGGRAGAIWHNIYKKVFCK
jgi:hypothetical protein